MVEYTMFYMISLEFEVTYNNNNNMFFVHTTIFGLGFG